MDMEILAFAAFAALVIAWLVAPSSRVVAEPHVIESKAA
jgi:hypothetical protein